MNKNCIAYGLAAIKNLGSKAASAIADHRKSEGDYTTVSDLCTIDSHLINRKSLESLIQAGACDNLEGHRAQLFEIIDDALRIGHKITEEASSLQENLFNTESDNSPFHKVTLPNIEEWSKEECLNREKNIIGFYLSGNPLEKYIDDLEEFTNISLIDIPSKKHKEIRIGGIIRTINNKYDKHNKPWAIIELNNYAGKADVFVFNEIYEKYKNILKSDACIFIKGSPSNRDDESGLLKMVAGTILPLDKIRDRLSRYINVILDYTQNDGNILNNLKTITDRNNGRCGLILHLKSEAGVIKRILAKQINVSATKEFLHELRSIFGNKNVWIS